MKKKFTFLMAALMLLTIIASTGRMWGQNNANTTATITFANQSSGGDSSTAYTTSNFVSTGIASSDAAFGTITCSATSKCYKGKPNYGLKAGASSSAGSFTISFTALTNVTQITLNRASYASDKTTTITVKNGNTILANAISTPNSSSFENMNITDLNIASLSTLTVETGKYCYIKSITITYSSGSQAAATTTTISADGITNNDVYSGTAAGSLSATVTSGGNAVDGATVTWSGSDDDVATINASTGAVTLVAAGTVTFTATYAGVSGTYQGSSDTYEMTVVDNTPYVQPTEIEITPNYSFWGKTAQFSGNDFSELSGEKDNVSLNWTKGTGSTYANTTSMRFYKDNTLTFTAPTGYEIKSIVITFSTTQSDITFSPTGYTLSGTTGTWTGAANAVTMSRPSNASNYAQITKFTITIGLPSSVATPTFSPAAGNYIGAQNITIACQTTGAAIYYTLDGTTPTESSTLYSGAINITSNTTIKAIAIKEDESSSVATAEYTITTPLTTMQEIYDKAVQVGSTTTNVYITFDNWVVSGASTTYAFVTDGTKGFYINNYSGHGFNQGDVLSGTANCPLYLNNGSARLVITSSTTGLEVNSGGNVEVADIPMANLAGVNTGAVVSYHDLTYSNYMLSDGTTSIKPYSTLYSYSSLTSGKKYNVTGVYWQYNTTTKEILPRSSYEICLAAQMTAPSFEPFSYLYPDGGPATQNVAISGTDFTEALTVTAPENYQVSNDNSTWGTTTTFAQSSGNVSGTLYVRLVGGLKVGIYNGDLTFTSGNYLTTKTSALAGTVSANATYAITLNQSSEATIAADYAVAEAGQTITLSYSNLDDCYTLTGWTVLDGNANEVPVTNNQFTMPASAVEVEGIFTLKTFTVQYSVNGEIKTALNQTGIDCGDAVTLKTASDISAASIALPTGYAFAGWSTEAGNTNIISSLIVSANTTLYAVLLPSGAATSYEKVTKLSDITTGTYFIVSDFYVLPSATTSSAPVMSDKYIIGASLSDTYNTPINGTLWYFTGTNDAMTIKNGENKYLYTNNTNNSVRVGDTQGTWTFEINDVGFAMKSNNNRYCATTNNNDWRSYTTANSEYYRDGGKIYLYKEVIPTSYTLIEEVTSTPVTLPSIESTYLITVKSNGVLTVEGEGTGTAANLIIEDGGQLITSSANVKATVKKNITAPSAWTQDNKTGWYAISSTVGTISDITSVSNFANQTFDLYKYVESSNVGYGWINYNNPAQTSTFGGLVNGQGYLYARKDGATVSFTGNVNHTDVTLTGLTANNTANVNLQGIHLIGNPYTHNIYKGVALTATAGGMAETYYRLDGNNLWVVESDDTPIGPGQGFLVKVTTNNTTLTFTNNASAPGSSKANNDYIRFAVSNSEYEDATFALFQKGEGLRKINHRNTEAPMIYISQNDANYASATMDDDTKSFNLNFEAKTMGQYKLSYKVNGEFNYLHVIDRTTGEDIDMLLEGSYSFIGSPMDNAQRFIVRLGYLPNYEDNGEDIFAYQSGNDIVVSGEGELQIFDVMGRKVSTMNIYGVETISGIAQGVYIFRMEGKTQKIVVR
jgi:Listeria-Bacteroides repeat domain (List_Bact_rpt).